MLASASALAITIDHRHVDLVPLMPQEVMDAVGQQTWVFAHASVGGNLLDGMQDLNEEDSVRYRLVQATAGDRDQILPPPAVTVPGTIYDARRGNPGWEVKFEMFDTAVRDLGWRFPTVTAAMDKLCYIDEYADVDAYLTMMVALEQDFPQTRFIYATRPLLSEADNNWVNILASTYNQAVRAHCQSGNRLLFDIADIESHDPDGNAITFTEDGQVYERLYSGYTDDGGHLNAVGRRRAALAWYMAAAALGSASVDVPADVVAPAARITAIAPNPFNPATTIHFAMERAGRAELTLFDTRGQLVMKLIDTEVAAGDHAVTWRGVDRSGRSLPSGAYVARLQAEGATSTQLMVLIR